MRPAGTRVVLITGASSGIGRACAKRLARRGHTVFGTSRRCRHRPDRPTSAEAAEPGMLRFIRMDVDNDDSVRHGIDLVIEKAGRLDIVVNNAAWGIAGSVEDTSVNEARALFETNVWGAVRVCRAVLPIMREQRSGYIANIGSIAGRIALPFQGLYSAGKSALAAMTEALRMEVRPFGIHVVLIEPGDTRTPFTARRRRTAASLWRSPYGQQLERVMRVVETDETNGSSPDRVARVLERIIVDPSPQPRYTIGAPVDRVAVALKNLLPARLMERVLMRHYGMRCQS